MGRSFAATCLATVLLAAGWITIARGQGASGLPIEPVKESGQSITGAFEGWYQNSDGSYTLLVGYFKHSRGNLNESQVHLTRAEWLDQSGPIAPNKWGGLAILDSPENPHFPTGWHCRDDGWAGAAFNMDEPFVLEAGKTLRLKHRIILHRGNAEEARIQDRFAEWAARPAIAIGLAKRE